jgi:hypothetical protein
MPLKRRAGTTILLAVPQDNLFFTEQVVRHFQRHTDDTVNLLLITNDDTSVEVRCLVWLLGQHDRTHIHHAEGCRDRPIGQSIDAAMRGFRSFREQLLFTHIDLFYDANEFWKCPELANGAKLASGRFVQEPLWYKRDAEPIPRPADDHLLIDTSFYYDNELVFRAYARAKDAFAESTWLASELHHFQRRNGQPIGPEYPLDPFNLSHLKLAVRYGPRYRSMWAYHYPKQVHFNSVLRALHFGVRRLTRDDGSEQLIVPRAARTNNGGYHWRTLIRYAIVSSQFFNPLSDYVIPLHAVAREDAQETKRELLRLEPSLTFLRDVVGPLPYRIIGRDYRKGFEIVWSD